MTEQNDGNKKPMAPEGAKNQVHHKKKAVHKSEKTAPKSYRNVVMLFIAFVLFAYAGFISIYPKILTSTFNIEDFTRKVYTTTGLITTIGDVEFKVKPDLDMVITFTNWNSKHLDEQECFEAGKIEITTNPFSIFTKNFDIKEMEVKNVKYFDQIYNTGENKLHYLSDMNFSQFGADKVTVSPGPVHVKNFKITYIEPTQHRENKRDSVKYSRSDVRNFLQTQTFKNVIVK